MTVNQRVSGSSPEGGASKSTTYSVFAVGGFLFVQYLCITKSGGVRKSWINKELLHRS